VARFLSPATIARTALELGDEEGPAAMSMRLIAARLGCDPMALYRHFANREALLDAVADLAFADVADPDPTLRWDERLVVTAVAMREAALRHPGIAGHVASRPPLGSNGQRLGAGLLAALRDGGVPPGAAVRILQTLVAYLAAGLAMAVQAGTRDERWWQASEVVDALAGERGMGEELFAVGSVEQFAYGLDLLMAGIRAQAGVDATS
jgi:AcrR family transcriptional regulator